MKKLAGVYEAKKKNGQIYYRSSITFLQKHISLGSFSEALLAHYAYLEADAILHDAARFSIEQLDIWFTPTKKVLRSSTEDSYMQMQPEDISRIRLLALEKVITLLNFRDHGIYLSSPIYLKQHFFYYYLSATHRLTFDKDDLFYYSSHKIMKRGNHLFVADYGMQITITSRYGIKSYAVKDRDYRFINQDDTDFRYANLEIINHYHGVQREGVFGNYKYRTRIHINGNFQIGLFDDEETAAIAYNKAADYCHAHGITKQFPVNYIEGMSPKEYARIYSAILLPKRFTASPIIAGNNPQS